MPIFNYKIFISQIEFISVLRSLDFAIARANIYLNVLISLQLWKVTINDKSLFSNTFYYIFTPGSGGVRNQRVHFLTHSINPGKNHTLLKSFSMEGLQYSD